MGAFPLSCWMPHRGCSTILWVTLRRWISASLKWRVSQLRPNLREALELTCSPTRRNSFGGCNLQKNVGMGSLTPWLIVLTSPRRRREMMSEVFEAWTGYRVVLLGSHWLTVVRPRYSFQTSPLYVSVQCGWWGLTTALGHGEEEEVGWYSGHGLTNPNLSHYSSYSMRAILHEFDTRRRTWACSLWKNPWWRAVAHGARRPMSRNRFRCLAWQTWARRSKDVSMSGHEQAAMPTLTGQHVFRHLQSVQSHPRLRLHHRPHPGFA